jgi:hypothetical protein
MYLGKLWPNTRKEKRIQKEKQNIRSRSIINGGFLKFYNTKDKNKNTYPTYNINGYYRYINYFEFEYIYLFLY